MKTHLNKLYDDFYYYYYYFCTAINDTHIFCMSNEILVITKDSVFHHRSVLVSILHIIYMINIQFMV